MSVDDQTLDSVLCAPPQEVQYVIPESETKPRENYICFSGVRTTDTAMVFHFYPLVDAKGKFKDWNWDIRTALEIAMPKVFNTEQLSCGYTEEYNSYFVIAGGYGGVPDPRGLTRKFLDTVDRALLS